MSPNRIRQALHPGNTYGAAAHVEHDVKAVKLHFLASLNHEIRTPLSGMLGMVELLLETPLDLEQQDYVRAVRSCAATLYELLNDTLEYTALASDSVNLDVAEFDVQETLQSAHREFAALQSESSQKIEFHLSQHLPGTAIGDAYRIRQLLTLLLQYARRQSDTTPGEAPVSISVEDCTGSSPLRPAEFVLRISASHALAAARGAGVEEQLRNFDLLEQGLNRRFDGLGLGLALARRITRLLGGDFAVKSMPGGDTLIRTELPLRLPISKVSYTASEFGDTAKQAVQRILVVEDNRIALRVLSAVLSKGTVDFDTAMDGPSAIAAAATRRYELILMDVQMPEMDGIEATRRIRELPGYDTVPILALTADTNDEVRAACRLGGMDAFLNKPIHAGELLTTVRRYLAG